VADADADGVSDACDNCPGVANASQADGDLDGAGAACDCDDADPDVRPGIPEVCDGLDTDCNPATPDCPPVCGNDVLEAGEACDDGNTNPDDGCSPTCTIELCGDGAVQHGLFEACDDGNSDPNDFCTNTCGRNVGRDAFVTSTTPSRLAMARRTDGAGAAVGPTGVSLDDISFSPGGILFGVSDGAMLVRVDPATGQTTPVGATGMAAVKAIDFSPEGTLFGVASDGLGIVQLITIDASTGAATVVGPTGYSNVQALAFDAAGTLFGASLDSSTSCDLITIDRATGAGLAAGHVNAALRGLDFHADGTLYGVTASPEGLLVRINLQSQTATVIGDPGIGLLSGIRFAPAGCPIAPVQEVCDGIDNNCDGTADDGFTPPSAVPETMEFTAPSDLVWDAVPGAGAYRLYHGTIPAGSSFVYNHACLFPSLASPAASVPQEPEPGAADYYLASATFCAGEGSLGADSQGNLIPRPSACP